MKITIITPTFNSEKTIEDAIKSVLDQGYPNIEYIIIDGGSQDSTLEICNKYKMGISKLISEPDNGISDAFNKGIRNSSGDVIGILNSDDLLTDNALQLVAKNMKPETDVFYGNALRLFPNGIIQHYDALKLKRLYECMALIHPSTFIKRESYKRFGVYNETLRMSMDRELLLRMLDSGARFQYFNKALSVYRMGGTSDSNYFKLVLPEKKRISIMYGMPISIASYYNMKSYLQMKIANSRFYQKMKDKLKNIKYTSIQKKNFL